MIAVVHLRGNRSQNQKQSALDARSGIGAT
jgi:hypothetical protein